MQPYKPTKPVMPPDTGRKQGETGVDLAAPFKLPEFSTAEFQKAQAAYVAKFGYTINLPGLDDILHVSTIQPMTDQEQLDWKAKNWKAFSYDRYTELKKNKDKKRARYLAMLGSPSPTILRNAGALLTSIDNAQDALTTLSVLGRVAIYAAPRLIGKAILGPVGWIMTAADVLNLAMAIGRAVTLPMMGKRLGEQTHGANPFSKASKIRRASLISRPFPTVGNVIEIAQVTDNVFGIGLCLGPIVGALEDIMTGGIRTLLGTKVRFGKKPPHTSPALYTAAKVPKALTMIAGSGYIPDDEVLLEVVAAHYLSQQELYSNNKGWNALRDVEDIKTAQISVPAPTNILTVEVLREEGHAQELFGGWPHSSEQWAVVDDIVNEYSIPGNDFLKTIMQMHAHDWLGHALGAMMTGAHEYEMSNLEGPDKIEVNYTEQAKWLNMMLQAGVYPDPTNPPGKIKMLQDLLSYNDFNGVHMGTIDYLRYMQDNGIKVEKVGTP